MLSYIVVGHAASQVQSNQYSRLSLRVSQAFDSATARQNKDQPRSGLILRCKISRTICRKLRDKPRNGNSTPANHPINSGFFRQNKMI